MASHWPEGCATSTVDCISISLGLKDFLLQSSSVFDGFPGIVCDPLLPIPLLCSKAGFAGLLVGYLQLLPLCIDVSQAFQRLVLSICQYLELFLPLEYEGSLYFKVSQLLHLKVLPPAQLDWIWYSSAPASVLVSLSLPAAAPLLTRTFGSDHLHIPLMIRWSIWFLSLPLNEY